MTMKDVAKIKQKLLDVIKDYNEQTRMQALAAKQNKDSQGRDDGSVVADKPQSTVFNAAAYLFVSYRLAQEFPDLKESKIIARFSTPWPPQSYHHVRDVSKTYSKKFSALTKSASMVLIFLVGSLIQVPPSLQDMIINVCSTGLIGYIGLVHVQLFNIFPLLVVLPGLIVAVVVHFLIKATNSSNKLSLAKLAPLPASSEKECSEVGTSSVKPKRKYYPGDVGYVKPVFKDRKYGVF
jgi:hypothetical protein